MSIAKRRLSPEESRGMALAAARDLLIETGPQSVTLKAVAGRIGRTHANLLHHFGSASGLQKALAAYLSDEVCGMIAQAILKSRSGEGSVRDIVDLTFDAFDKQGAAALWSWMMLTGNEDALDPIVDAIHALVDDMGEEGHEDREMHEDTLTLVLMALGDALIGERLSRSLGLSRDSARDIAERRLEHALEQEN
ncbi:MAG: TetR/AcrR family transcriptional regulator [Sphingomonadales bacterium]|nr:TetR/AcrR family transcriptional regulator [Sphingomonadales bacterium]PIX67361.1 MAG: TetR family transcriptional regulator [Sphingomonadales bacterium CG_4_10_14_3_um_filter_58_15]NCO48478.1 TetR/AcrR family transcriptional regulator [Sphingomonadales bacterium]NCO99294.1 TetR/AcrR family transcriptional regulator [Sphingomonadales bacterium]NCP27853.1 TetR/AcrR family transcriptional regulator [Sphingomonadales bacterium]